jgi:NAD(P)-dependent dehydrogenase (short-subunit alcohol dehydrogenase family)
MADPSSPPGIRFDGQVAIVTGAGRGLGAAYARLLAGRGAAVVVHDAGVAADGSGFDPAVADTVAREIMSRGGTAVACHENLESAAGCHRVVELAIERFERIDVLVHNAGLVIFASIEETDPTTWDRMVNLGIHAPFHLVQGALPHMRRQGYGRIVLTTSGRAMRLDSAAPGLAAYCIGKMGQLGLMVGVAVRQAVSGEELVELVEGFLVAVEGGRRVVAHGPEIAQRFGHHAGELAGPSCSALESRLQARFRAVHELR